MNLLFDSQYITYQSTGFFSKTVLDYLEDTEDLKPFFEYKANLDGIRLAIENRKKHNINRQLLSDELTRQYSGIPGVDTVHGNIKLLRDKNTFTVCTAHQPNLFTGHLYFIYKIIHVIKLADILTKELPEYRFVPVFFMGSEDADLEELNNIQFEGKKYVWKTKQTGAVGRMFVDKDLLDLISAIEGRLIAEPFGKEIVTLLRECFIKGNSIERATFLFVHGLFKESGLIVLLPDNAAYKRELASVFEDDLFENSPSEIVKKSSERLSQHHHAQAFARDINLFYMKDDLRNRIVNVDGKFMVHETDIMFTKEQLQSELKEHPERFSPNVILRGLFQERILPDIAFVGGGGELAYWLQLKGLFHFYKTPYPVLFLRNSFLIIEKKWNELREKLELPVPDLFSDKEQLFQAFIKRESPHSLSLDNEKQDFEKVFDTIIQKAAAIDHTLKDHILSLRANQLKKLEQLEKKFIAAEKKNNEAAGRQIHKLKETLFPDGGLQERTDNFMLLYSKWGNTLFNEIYRASPLFEPSFTIVTEKTSP